MNYSIEQLPNKPWGIYLQLKLLATIGCYQTGLKILGLLRKETQQQIESVAELKVALH